MCVCACVCVRVCVHICICMTALYSCTRNASCYNHCVHGLATGLSKHLTVNCRGRTETPNVFCSHLFGRDRITTGTVTLSNITEIRCAKFKNSVNKSHKHSFLRSKRVFNILGVNMLIRPLISCSGWVAFRLTFGFQFLQCVLTLTVNLTKPGAAQQVAGIAT
jgi:hypothetical protein